MSGTQKVAVIGAGIVGVCSAMQLQQLGYQVTLFDGKGIAQECSKGNAGHFATEQVFPLADASLLPQVPKMLLDPLGPFRIRLSYLLKAMPWFMRFLNNMRPTNYNRNREALKAINQHAIGAYKPLLEKAEAEHLLTLKGSLLTFETSSDEEIQRRLTSFERQGVNVQLLNRSEVQQLEPSLSSNVKAAILFTDVGHTCDPEKFCIALADHVLHNGGQLIKRHVTALVQTEQGWSVTDDQRQSLYFDKVIVATGAWSKSLVTPLGYKVPLDTERGYHIMLPQKCLLSRPVASAERKFIMTPMESGLRLAGTVEFAGLHATPDERRAEALLPHAQQMLNKLETPATETLPRWMGFRPSLPDSLPVIGEAPNHTNLFFNFAHQHLGLTLAAISGKLLAQTVEKQKTDIDLTPFQSPDLTRPYLYEIIMSNYQQHIQILSERFQTALAQHQFDSALIYSGHQHYQFMDDNSYPFKTNPYFKYWLPLTRQQYSYIYIQPGQKPLLFLHQIEDYWHAQPTIPEGEWQNFFDIQVIQDASEVKDALQNRWGKCALISENSSPAVDWELRLNPVDLINQLHFQRAYKTQYEIDCMQVANNLAAKAHIAAKDAFYAGKSELEIHHAYLAAIDVRESQLPYNNIVALNHAGSILHYDHYQTQAPAEQLSFLIDAGAEYNGYNADISRSYVAHGEQHNEFRALFDAYCREYYALLDEIKLNKPYLDFHDSAHRRIAKLLSEFDIVKTSPEETYEKGYNRLFFPCGVGHYIGLQVHDVGGYLADERGSELSRDSRYPFLRLNRPMEAGIVFTVEPGIYFIDQLLKTVAGSEDFNWQRVEQLKVYGGFRLEDCIAMTEDGYINLSQNGFDQL